MKFITKLHKVLLNLALLFGFSTVSLYAGAVGHAAVVGDRVQAWSDALDNQRITESLLKPQQLPKVEGVKVNWKRNLNSSSDWTVFSLNADIVNNQYYHANNKGEVLVVDLTTGKVLWSKYYNEELNSSINVINNQIFLSTQNAQGLAIDLHTVDVTSEYRDKIKRFSLSSEQNAPIVFANQQGLYFIKTIDGALTAYDEYFDMKWEYTAPNFPVLVLRNSSAPVLYNVDGDEQLVAAFANGELISFNPNSGDINWRNLIVISNSKFDLDNVTEVTATPILDEDCLYMASTQREVIAVDKRSGAVEWRKKLAEIYTDLAQDEGNIYATSKDGLIYSIGKNSFLNWTQDLLKHRKISNPLPMLDYIVVGDDSGYLYFFSKEQGELIGTHYLSGNIIKLSKVAGKLLVKTSLALAMLDLPALEAANKQEVVIAKEDTVANLALDTFKVDESLLS